MNTPPKQTNWLPVLAFCALLLLAALAYSAYTILNACRPPEQRRAAGPAPDRTAPGTVPAPGAEPPEPPLPRPPATAGTGSDVSSEFENIRKKEQARKELIENLRKHARENPEDPGALSKERIDALEKSGDSLE